MPLICRSATRFQRPLLDSTPVMAAAQACAACAAHSTAQHAAQQIDNGCVVPHPECPSLACVQPAPEQGSLPCLQAVGVMMPCQLCNLAVCRTL